MIERYFEAGAMRDFDELDRLRHPAWTAEWPQSGERVPSHAADRKIHEHYEGYPAHELRWAAGIEDRWTVSPLLPVRVTGGGDLWVGEAVLTYPDGPEHAIMVIELREGLVWRETVYWGAPFEAAPWRADLVDRIPSPGVPRVVRGASPEEEAAYRAAAAGLFAAVGNAGSAEEARRIYLDQLRALYTDDAIQEFPQSGEVVRGLSNIVALVERHPDFPGGSLRRVVGAGDLVVVEARLTYDQGVFFEAMVQQFRGDRICRSTEYYAMPFEAPEWRAEHVERM
jgi:hypothetical protein